MESSLDTLLAIAGPLGSLTATTFNTLPLPVLVIVAGVCVALFHLPSPSHDKLPLHSPIHLDSKPHTSPNLIPLPSPPHTNTYMYLDASGHRVASAFPLLPPTPPQPRRNRQGRTNRLRFVLRAYRARRRLGDVPEIAEASIPPTLVEVV